MYLENHKSNTSVLRKSGNKYAELVDGNRCRLVVVGVETGSRWGDRPAASAVAITCSPLHFQSRAPVRRFTEGAETKHQTDLQPFRLDPPTRPHPPKRLCTRQHSRYFIQTVLFQLPRATTKAANVVAGTGSWILALGFGSHRVPTLFIVRRAHTSKLHAPSVFGGAWRRRPNISENCILKLSTSVDQKCDFWDVVC